METTRRWIGYDTFKLIVAILLLLLLLFLMLQPPAGAPGQATLPAAAPVATQAPAVLATAAPPTAAVASPPTSTPAPIPTAAPVSPPTQAPTAVPTAAPTAAPTNAPEAVTATPQAAPAATTAVECKAPSASRLVIGKNAMTLGDLNLRSEPKIGDNILTVSVTGATVKVLDGPVCMPYLDGAYLWWQVQTSSGKTGYSAENYYNGLGYYLKPLP
jgi:hypothetical protein